MIQTYIKDFCNDESPKNNAKYEKITNEEMEKMNLIQFISRFDK